MNKKFLVTESNTNYNDIDKRYIYFNIFVLRFLFICHNHVYQKIKDNNFLS